MTNTQEGDHFISVIISPFQNRSVVIFRYSSAFLRLSSLYLILYTPWKKDVWMWPQGYHFYTGRLLIDRVSVKGGWMFCFTHTHTPWLILANRTLHILWKSRATDQQFCSQWRLNGQTYAMMVLITISLIFSQIRVVLTPLAPRYCHKAFKALERHTNTHFVVVQRQVLRII